MTDPLHDIGFRSMAAVITKLRARNKELNLEVYRLRASRDEWKRKATQRTQQIRYLKDQVKRWKSRAPEWRRPPRRQKAYTDEQWAEHERILARIRAIPVRPPE